MVQPAASQPSGALAAEQQAAQQRWRQELTAFQAEDDAQPAQGGGVLFVGSSSVRMWSTLKQDFPEWPQLLNRGFGGSQMRECLLLVETLVLRHRPRHVLLYAGDNDLSMGRSPLQVMEDFAAFTATVRQALPETRISFIAIKPSAARLRWLPQVQLTNTLVAAYLRTQTNMDYVDVYTPMMDAQGQPRASLFLPDQLHLNAEGYRLWRDVLRAQLLPAPAPQ